MRACRQTNFSTTSSPKSNCDIFEWELSPEDMHTLDSINRGACVFLLVWYGGGHSMILPVFAICLVYRRMEIRAVEGGQPPRRLPLQRRAPLSIPVHLHSLAHSLPQQYTQHNHHSHKLPLIYARSLEQAGESAANSIVTFVFFNSSKSSQVEPAVAGQQLYIDVITKTFH